MVATPPSPTPLILQFSMVLNRQKIHSDVELMTKVSGKTLQVVWCKILLNSEPHIAVLQHHCQYYM